MHRVAAVACQPVGRSPVSPCPRVYPPHTDGFPSPAAADFIYQEAFLTTYRTFLSSEALVERLLYRYGTFQRSEDPARQRAAKNAFSLLVRVVDDLA